jgi:hypothetical protein
VSKETCRACEPGSREIERDRAALCNGCLNAVLTMDDRTERFGGILERDVDYLRRVESDPANVLRRIGAECVKGAPTRVTLLGQVAVITFDGLERTREAARRAPAMRARRW